MIKTQDEINIEQMLNYEYLDLTYLQKQGSLFWEKQQQIYFKFLEADVTFLLYKPNELQTDKDIFLGKEYYSKKLKLPKINAKGKKIKFFPKYFVALQEYGCIYEVNFQLSLSSFRECFTILLQIPELTLKVFFEHSTKEVILKQINRNMKIHQTQKKKTIDIQQLYQQQETNHLNETALNLLATTEELLRFCILIELKVETKTLFLQKIQELKNLLASYSAQVNEYIFEQKKAFEMLYLLDSYKNKQTSSLTILSKATKLFPLANLGLYDANGKKIGTDSYDNDVRFNLWTRNEYRVNSNFIILGQSGMGKTTLLQTLLAVQEEQVDIIIIDPEAEYTSLFYHKDGYCQHIIHEHQTVYDFLQNKTFSLEQKQFLLRHFQLVTQANYQKQKSFETILFAFIEANIKQQSFLEFVFAYNPDRIILNYVTLLYKKKVLAIDKAKRIHHFILSTALTSEPNNMQLILFELLFQLWQLLINKKSKRTIFVIDESYFLFQEEGGMIIELLRNMVKRARKYNISIGLITQNITDLLHPRFKHLLLPIFDNCSYKFLFRLGEFDLQTIQQLLHFTVSDQATFEHLEKGQCLVFAGSNYGRLKVEKRV